MVRFTDILEKVRAYHPKADTDLMQRAYVYSARMHEGQLRKSGDPYFVHPLSVAAVIADLRMDASSVCAALLHDVVEDCDVPTSEIESLFGKEVAFLVDGVTKLGKVNFGSKEDRQVESFRKMLIAMARDIRVLVVKLGDRLDNMRTLEHMKPESQERIARETLEIYAPLAGRLGIQWLKAELEDLSFKYLDPESYAQLAEKVEKHAKESDKDVAETVKRLRKMLLARGFNADVTGRRKHLYSIHRKMKNNAMPFEQLQDLLAYRCLMENVSDCYAALGVIHQEWTPVPGRFKDYIALPKPNMYQSLHTTVIGPGHRRIEVQLRTHEMHRTAEDGIAAHWQYKDRTGGLDPKDAQRFAWLRQLMEFQQEVRDPEEFYDVMKGDLFPEEVYVFTPAGDVRTLPRGATPVDFAYSIHSEVGHHCAGARVNGVIVQLKQQLRNGDVVEIITSNSQHPGKDWLDFVTTSRARSRIRGFLRQKERARSARLGREILEKEMRKREVSFSKLMKSSELPKLLAHFKVQVPDELFVLIGYGKIPAQDVVAELLPDTTDAKDKLRPSFFERTVQRVANLGGGSDGGIRIEGMDDLLVRFAKCCNPVQGDPVTGWITRGRGVTVHRRGCMRAMELDPDRRVDVSWAPNTRVDLPVSLRVTTDDRPGILSLVTSVITENGLNITEASCKSEDAGRAVNVFQFNVQDLDRLRNVMRSIRKLSGVEEVERVSAPERG